MLRKTFIAVQPTKWDNHADYSIKWFEGKFSNETLDIINKELAKLARQHNNANILSLPARFIEEDKAIKITEAFLETEFEGGRHERRVNKIDR